MMNGYLLTGIAIMVVSVLASFALHDPKEEVGRNESSLSSKVLAGGCLIGLYVLCMGGELNDNIEGYIEAIFATIAIGIVFGIVIGIAWIRDRYQRAAKARRIKEGYFS